MGQVSMIGIKRGRPRSNASKNSEVRQLRVKRYESQGVTYTYHRLTGTALPNLPYDHPTFIAAFKAEDDKIQKNTLPLGYGEGIHDLHVDDFMPTSQIDAIAYSVPQIIKFVLVSKPGNCLFYHSGDLVADAQSHLDTKHKQQYLMLASEFGLLGLRQKRVRPNWNHYFAVRTDESIKGMPLNAVEGRISPEEYRALVAVNERQASVSVTRAIRDAIGTTDDDASQMRNDMIRKGWMMNTRPPELTDFGLSLMS